MEATSSQYVWVEYGGYSTLRMSVPSNHLVTELIHDIKERMYCVLDAYDDSQIALYSCPQEKEGKGTGKQKKAPVVTNYRPGMLVSDILASGVGVDEEHPILIRTIEGTFRIPSSACTLIIFISFLLLILSWTLCSPYLVAARSTSTAGNDCNNYFLITCIVLIFSLLSLSSPFSALTLIF